VSTGIPGGDTTAGKAGFFTGAGCLTIAVAISALAACGAIVGGEPGPPKQPAAVSVTRTVTPAPSATITVTARPATPRPAPRTTADDRDHDGIPDALDDDADGDGVTWDEDYDDHDAHVRQAPDLDQGAEGDPTTSAPGSGGDTGVPAGATAICEDGTVSYSAHRQGTCSHHGGVARWL
jgi:Protein of unknown function (DUF3761)